MRSYTLESYIAGMISAAGLIIFGYQYASVADWIIRICSLGAH